MSRMETLYAICPDPDSVQGTVDALLSAGLKAENITVISSEPLEAEFGRHETTLMPWLAVVGALLGGAGGFLLVSLTQKSYPIVTGGMPIVPPWTDGIITYELTMLAAILTTLIVLLFTAPLLRWNNTPHDTEIADGKILVEVTFLPEEIKEKVKAVLDAYSNAAEKSES